MEETHRQKRWVGEGGPGGRAFSVITPALQWDGEGDKMRELWALPMLSDEIEKKKKKQSLKILGLVQCSSGNKLG